jgi:hypothetical protein
MGWEQESSKHKRSKTVDRRHGTADGGLLRSWKAAMAMYVAGLLNGPGFLMSSVSVVQIQMIGMEYI